ncbi:MAG: PIG-L deacetylase family protein [Halodesulfovibrio sp.]|uniref:PIG-L deacetylase family protein n=1 Tax=Halodesulfovibrio sp. TaxID=1912772 RepID=UPI00359D0E96
MLSNSQKMFVVAAHPDDEVLGCGGTIAKAVAAGMEVSVLLLGEGPTSRQDSSPVSERTHATDSAQIAAQTLGVANIYYGALPDNKFDTVPLLDVIKIIEKHAEDVQPDLVITHHSGDLNVDHSITHRAVMTAFRPLPESNQVSLLGFEVLSSTEYATPNAMPTFVPNIYVNISKFLSEKFSALEAYRSEMRAFPHPRSFEAVEHLARLRGAHSGCNAAEAFVLYRARF